MKKKIICLTLIFLCMFGISFTVHAEDEYYDDEWEQTEEYTEDENEYYDEYYYNDDYTDENYEDDTEYYEEENQEYPVEEIIEENPVEEIIEESPVEEVIEESPVEEVIEESSVEESSAEESISGMTSEVSKEESSQIETSFDEISQTEEPKILNLAFNVKKEENKSNIVSGTVLWGIVFVLAVFSIIFLPRTKGIEFIKDRYRYRKAKKITKLHIK